MVIAAFPVLGGFTVTIHGKSFSTEATVAISGRSCGVTFNNHTLINCTAPSNFGVGHELVVSAAGQRSDVIPFAYDGPVIMGVSPAVLDARSGSDIVISGYNFGLQVADGETQPIHVQIASGTCSGMLFVKDSEVRCKSPSLQLVGLSQVTISTWNPDVGNDTDVMQTSAPYNVSLKCARGYYGQHGEFCLDCPPNAECMGGDADPVALPGYYLISRTSFDACRPSEACVGGNGSNPCARGYSEIRCSKCSEVCSVPFPGAVGVSCRSHAWVSGVAEVLSVGLEVCGVSKHGVDIHRVVHRWFDGADVDWCLAQ
jgi:hypothetical protein